MSAPPPPPPWRLAGPALVVAGLVPLPAARALVPPGVRVLPVAPGLALGIVLAAEYRRAEPLAYSEAAGIVGPVVAGGRTGGWVTHMWVDDPVSRTGGREMWGLPKELASFAWSPGSVEVRDAAGTRLLAARWDAPAGARRVRAGGAYLGRRDGRLRRARLDGAVRLAPVRAELELPPEGPLAALRLRRPRWALAGEVDMWAEAPRLLARRGGGEVGRRGKPLRYRGGKRHRIG